MAAVTLTIDIVTKTNKRPLPLAGSVLRKGLVPLALFATLALTGAACAGFDPPATRAGSAQAALDASVFEELLNKVPDSPYTRASTLVSDYARYREVFAIPLPGPEAGQDALEEYTRRMRPATAAGGMLYFVFYAGAVRHMDRAEYLGFNMRNVDQIASASFLSGSESLEIVRGRFDPKATAQALAECSECEPGLQQEHRGISFYSWGPDFDQDPEKVLALPAFDPLGRGGRIAVFDDYVFRTLGTNDMEILIDLYQGEGRSLAENEDFLLLAKGLDELQPYVSLFSEDTLGPVDMVNPEVRRQLRGQRLLRRYRAFATGQGKDKNGRYMALVLVHRDAESAKENVELLMRRIQEASSVLTPLPWRELVKGVEVSSDGRLLKAKLRGSFPAINWQRWYWSRDPLLWHE